MLREMIDPLGGNRPSLAAAFVVISTFQMEWKQVDALETLSRSGDGDDMGDISEEEPMDIWVVKGEQENATSEDVTDVQNEAEVEDLVPVTFISTDAPVASQVAPMKNEGEKEVQYEKNPVEDPAIKLNNETESGEYDNPAVSQVAVNIESSRTESPVMESAGTESLVTEPSVTESLVTEPAGMESLVTESAETESAVMEPLVTESLVIESAGTDSSVTESAGTESPVTDVPTQTMEPPTIVAATIKPSLRIEESEVTFETVTNDGARTQATGYMQQSNNPLVFVALAAICCVFLFVWGRKRRSGVTSNSSTSDGTSSKGLKVQYTKVPDEQPLNHNQDYDNEYCDDYEEDTFTNDRDNWDDWEGDSTQTQLNPFAAAPSAPRSTALCQSNPSPYKSTQPLPPPPQQHAQLQESVVAIKDVVQAPPISSHSAATDAEKESEGVDDLFSQFGMVLPFKKRAVVPLSPAATSAASVVQPAAAAATSSVPSFPTAAEASALFAAEMDDELTAVDAAEEWGEDDEWVKGI